MSLFRVNGSWSYGENSASLARLRYCDTIIRLCVAGRYEGIDCNVIPAVIAVADLPRPYPGRVAIAEDGRHRLVVTTDLPGDRPLKFSVAPKWGLATLAADTKLLAIDRSRRYGLRVEWLPDFETGTSAVTRGTLRSGTVLCYVDVIRRET